MAGKQKGGHQRGRKGKSHKFAGRNNGPARERYNRSDRLMERKIRNLIEHSGMTRAEAVARWLGTRTRGRKA